MKYFFQPETRSAIADYKLTIPRRKRIAEHLLGTRLQSAVEILESGGSQLLNYDDRYPDGTEGAILALWNEYGLDRALAIACARHKNHPRLRPSDELLLTLIPPDTIADLVAWYLIRHAGGVVKRHWEHSLDAARLAASRTAKEFAEKAIAKLDEAVSLKKQTEALQSELARERAEYYHGMPQNSIDYLEQLRRQKPHCCYAFLKSLGT